MARPKKSADLVLQGGVTSAFFYIGLIHGCRVTITSNVWDAHPWARWRWKWRQRRRLPSTAGCIPLQSLASTHSIGSASSRKFRQVLAKLDKLDTLDKLDKLDKHGDTALFSLFQAQPASARAWRVVSAAVRRLLNGPPDGRWAATRAAIVAAVGLKAAEGGLNLAMPPSTMLALFRLGVGGPAAVVLARLRMAKIRQHAVALDARHRAAVAGDAVVIRVAQLGQDVGAMRRLHGAGQLRGTAQVSEQQGQTAAPGRRRDGGRQVDLRAGAGVASHGAGLQPSAGA